jgi:hypothetical protein
MARVAIFVPVPYPDGWSESLNPWQLKGDNMQETLAALGRGIVKILISFLAGVGVGFLVFGILVYPRPEIWSRRDPPAELFVGIGSGALTTAFLLLILFWSSWRRKRLPGGQLDAGASPSAMAGEVDETTSPADARYGSVTNRRL